MGWTACQLWRGPATWKLLNLIPERLCPKCCLPLFWALNSALGKLNFNPQQQPGLVHVVLLPQGENVGSHAS